MPSFRRRTTAVLATLALVAAPAAAKAQAWTYASFQAPAIVDREYNFAVADGGDAGTSLLFQWREGFSPVSQLSLDVGFADPDFGDGRFLVGGTYARQLIRANSDVPLDLMMTGGVYGAFGGDHQLFRIPVGVSVGHRFPLEGQLAITPYIHPRASIDIPTGEGSDTEINVAFDLGVNFEVTRQLSLRFGAVFNDLEQDGFGLSVAYRPRGLRR
jgi:hypothetical protein